MYSPKNYWDGIAQRFGSADPEGLAAVIHPDSPAWFNNLMDRMQNRAWNAGLAHTAVANDARVLDVGCGTGRWLRRYTRKGISPMGLDATEAMLQRIIAGGLSCPIVMGRAQRLPFPDDTFDLVSDVTAVQHINFIEQVDVLNEMSRVLRPEGHLLLIELIRGNAPHIFPRRARDWSSAANAAGLTQIYVRGQEYLLLDRAFVASARMLRRLITRGSTPVLPGQTENQRGPVRSPDKKIYWAIRRVTSALSEIVEPLAERILPVQWATHAVMVFKKRPESGAAN
jgi:SAM-dependent methyltransferase